MHSAIPSPYLVPSDGSFVVASAPTAPPEGGDPEAWAAKLSKRTRQIAKLQRLLYADDRYSLLLVFQAMDAAGKDSAIRKVMSGVNPAGFQVFSFKQPSAEELDHDFMWRTSRALPEQGRIGVFNRSYYEEVLVVRVHPQFLGAQKLARGNDVEGFWDERLESIRHHELHLARNGTVVLKFWLNVSQAEQHRRFVARIDRPDKNWKFSASDVRESRHFPAYMDAYQEALNATSRSHAPWYAIPADDKGYARMCIADIIKKTLEALPLRWPVPSEEDRARMLELRKELVDG